MFKYLKLSVTALILTLMCASAHAETNIFVVLDGSNSMWGQIDGKAKIETALGTLYQSVDSFPENANAGLIAYGHREEKNCKDVETLLPLSPLNKDLFIQSTNSFTPKGKTPIAESLVYTASQFNNNDANNNVVLISDGIETCGGDPCETIKKLREEDGLNINVHVIGFDVDEDAQKQLKCIADAGNGKYVTASNNQGLVDAFEEVTETVKVREEEFIAKQKPENTKTIEAEEVIFETSFDEDLSEEDWIIAEEKFQLHSIGDGKLSLAGGDELQNIFTLNRSLPEGDWQATIKFSADKILTGKEGFKLGIYQDNDNYILAKVLLIRHEKISGRFNSKFDGDRKKTNFVEILELDCHQEKFGSYRDCIRDELAFNDFFKDNVGELKLIKEGKLLKAFARFEYDYAKDWVPIGEFPFFKDFGKIAIGFDSGNPKISTGHLEHFKVEKLNISKQ